MAYNTGSDPTLAELITSKFIPEIYSRDVLMHTKSLLICAQVFNTHYKNSLRKGSKVWIPVFSEATVTEVTPGTEPTAVDTAGTAVSITVDNWFQAAAEISDLIEVEQEADYLKGASESCAYAIAKKVDTSIGVLFSALAGSSVYGSDGQTFTDAIFRDLVETLDEGDVPDDGIRVLIGDPSMKFDMNGIDKFQSTDFVKEANVPTGKIGTLYNSKVYVTNNLTAATTGNYGVYAHRDCIGVAIQKNPRSKVWNLGWKFITKIIVDCAWGADEIRDTFGKSFYTRKS